MSKSESGARFTSGLLMGLLLGALVTGGMAFSLSLSGGRRDLMQALDAQATAAEQAERAFAAAEEASHARAESAKEATRLRADLRQAQDEARRQRRRAERAEAGAVPERLDPPAVEE